MSDKDNVVQMSENFIGCAFSLNNNIKFNKKTNRLLARFQHAP